ncbi:hypothetical protein ACFL2Q_19080 [Thermodesulfobacteriota bacterium]
MTATVHEKLHQLASSLERRNVPIQIQTIREFNLKCHVIAQQIIDVWHNGSQYPDKPNASTISSRCRLTCRFEAEGFASGLSHSSITYAVRRRLAVGADLTNVLKLCRHKNLNTLQAHIDAEE